MDHGVSQTYHNGVLMASNSAARS